MKYIITESQYNLIIESEKQIDLLQTMIDKEFELLQKDCDSDNLYDDYICDETSTIDFIKLIDIIKIKHHESPKIKLVIEIHYTFMKYKSYNELVLHLRRNLSKSTGLPIEIEYYSVNTMTDPQW